ncbi:MAG: hypothetical protein Q8L37_03045 [Candidatus Gottesmanbacteria bacterium]|nr:hypothetical protein [Candidatus Gottesmanbacteria bacterium]
MGEQSIGQLPVVEAGKPEMKTVPGVDVVKIGDSERRRPEEARVAGVVGATMEFLGDLSKANLAAKKELGEIASTRVGKALTAGAIGGGLEYLSEAALGMALNMVLSKIPVGNEASIAQVKKLFGGSLAQEVIADSATFVMYQKGNEFIGKGLPQIPSSYLVSSAMVNVLDWAARKGLNKPKDASYLIEVNETKDTSEKVIREFRANSVEEKKIGAQSDNSETTQKKSRLSEFGFAAGKVADFSNPVTLFGAAQVVEGVSAYIRAVGEIRSARKSGGAMKVDALLEEAKKAKTMGAAKRDKQERFLELYEKMGKDE